MKLLVSEKRSTKNTLRTSSFIPSCRYHQIDWNVDRNQVSNDPTITSHSLNQPLANSSDDPYTKVLITMVHFFQVFYL